MRSNHIPTIAAISSVLSSRYVRYPHHADSVGSDEVSARSSRRSPRLVECGPTTQHASRHYFQRRVGIHDIDARILLPWKASTEGDG